MESSVFNKLEELLNVTELLIIDFSAIVNSDYVNFDEFMKLVIQKRIKTVVSAEFYENYAVIAESDNEEQKNIARKAYTYLEMLDSKKLLMNLPDIYDNRELVKKLSEADNVCYLFYKVSEMAEAIKQYGNRFHSIIVDENKALIVSQDANDTLEILNITVDGDAAETAYFSIDDLPEESSTVFLSDKRRIFLNKFLAGGGEGAVYECNYRQNYLTKIYHDGQLNKLRIKKMLHMEKKQIMYKGLCWPEMIVYTEKNEPVGFVMKKVNGKSLSVVFDSYESVLEMFPNWKKRDLIRLCIMILTRIQYLHLFGILIGDVRMNNIVIDKNGQPSLVDLDSCQIDNLPCPGGFGDFTAPELQNQQFNKTLRTYDNESFSCAVIMFKILFCGLHPYDQIDGAERIEEDIANKNFPFTLNIHDKFEKILFNDYYSEVWKNTPYQFQQFLVDVFKNGKRPNIQTMIMMLKTYDRFIELNSNNYPLIDEFIFE